MRRLFAALPFLLPFPANAAGPQQVHCHFTHECVDLEPCQDSDYDMTIQFTPPSIDTKAAPDTSAGGFMAQVTDANGSFKAVPSYEIDFDQAAKAIPALKMTGFVSPLGTKPQRLMTLYDGTARYSIHMPAQGTAIYYQGTCEEAK